MVIDELSTEVITDLLRSSWLIHEARRRVYSTWKSDEERFAPSEHRAGSQAKIVAATLADRGRAPDHALAEPHAEWMFSLIGRRPRDTAFADIFLTRLGDWVEAHASPFVGGAADDLKALTDAERKAAVFPSEFPAPPPFAPLETAAVEPPGEVRFRFGILSDLHIGSPLGEATVRAAIAELNAAELDLVIQLGDVTDHGHRAEFELATKVLADLEMPVTTLMGNHDVYSYEEEALTGRDYYTTYFGRPPDGILVEHKGVRFAVLDTAENGISPFAPFNLVTGSFMEGRGGALVRGTFTSPEHEILAEIAAPGAAPAFVFMHHPPQPFTSFPPVLFGLRDADSGRLHATCDSGNVWGVFAGHTHRNARAAPFGDTPVVEVAIPRDFPCGYALVDVTEHGYAYRFVQLSDHDVVRKATSAAGEIQQRYGLGTPDSRAFTWTP